MKLSEELKRIIKGEVYTEGKWIEEYSTDASLFRIEPQIVVFPKNTEDLKALVRFVGKNKTEIPNLSLTARAGGTGMSGGSLSESVVMGFDKYFNNFSVEADPAGGGMAQVEPGVYYRDFEKATLKKDLLMPSYPASRSIAALGGIIANNAGGEKTLRYGKTADYVEEIKMVLADGEEYSFSKLNQAELEQKMRQNDFEGEVYSKMFNLLKDNKRLIENARPKVSKNSAGYALWDVWDGEYFDLTRLFCGAQGTLGIMSEAKLRLVRTKPHKKLAVLFLKDFQKLPDLVNKILPLDPEGLETFDHKTLKLALRFFPEIASKLKGENLLTLLWKFIPEFFISVRMLGLPKLVILVQFAEDEEGRVDEKLSQLEKILEGAGARYRIFHKEGGGEKYWVIRRESFNLLRKHVSGKRSAPFVDDFIVRPKDLPEVLPKIYQIMQEYNIQATLAGHAGSGNFHIIPLMDLKKEENRRKIPEVANKVYDLVLAYGGSITAEHNDGLIRGPYLKKMFGKAVYNLFVEVKKIFDPQNIFNPGKKVGADMKYAMEHLDI